MTFGLGGQTGRKNVGSALDHEYRVAQLIALRSWAVVGVSQDARKYGHRVFVALRGSGYHVMAVNPKGGIVAGQIVYPTLADLPDVPEVVVTVVPPPITEQTVNACVELGIAHIWMQPGSESVAAITAAQAQGLTVVAQDCAMVRRKQW